MTSYIDYLLRLEDQEAADVAFPPPLGRDGQPRRVASWLDQGRTVLPTRVVIRPAEYDDEGAETVSEIVAPGYWLVLRCAERDPAIEAMPECMSATDSALAGTGAPWIIFHRFAPDAVLGRVEPIFAGDQYPFQPGQPASTLDQWVIG